MDQGCVGVGGGGLWPWPAHPAPCETATTGDTGREPDDSAFDTGSIWVGGSCHCDGTGVGVHGAWVPALVLIAAALRRWAPVAAIAVALAALGPAARATDVQLLRLSDGGPFATMHPDIGEAWGTTVVFGANYAHDPAMVLLGNGEREPLVGGLVTAELAIGVNVGNAVHFGVNVPSHWAVQLDDPVPAAPGDVTVSFGVAPPLADRAWTAWNVAAVLPSGDQDALLGGPGAVLAALSHQRAIGDRGVLGAGSLGLRLQNPEVLPGVTIGSRIEVRAGVSAPLFEARGASTALATEVFGSLPLKLKDTRAVSVPFELEQTARVSLGPTTALRFGGGVGIGRAIGSPALRVVAALELGTSSHDNDTDGYVNVRDLCPNRAEDRDHHVDFDGCPDDDNDHDGFADAVDACRDDPETVNGLRDDDGCPDVISVLAVSLASPDPAFDRGTVTIGDTRTTLLAGERAEIELLPERALIVASAPGHRDKTVDLDLSKGGRFELTVPLEPILWGEVEVHLVDPAGAPLAGAAKVAGAEPETRPVGAEGATIRCWAGHAVVTGEAPGFAPRLVDVLVPRDGQIAVEITLAPLDLWQDGQDVQVRDEIAFGLDSAALTDASAVPLDLLARWLIDHPEITLFRIEGHADEPGSPSYNHALSQGRAEAVRDALVTRGVAADRLEVLGSGEARAGADGGLRRVTFLVVVWDDADIVPPAELAPAFDGIARPSAAAPPDDDTL